MDLVSTVIITYKRSLDVLGRAISSVLSQTYTNIELTIVNDAPEDVILASSICKYINSLNDNRIHYICHEKNMGANAARNTGLANSHGKYIAFLDDDDEWLPNKIEKQVLAFNQFQKVGMVYCGFIIRSDIGDYNRTALVPNDNEMLETLIEDNFIGSTSFPLILREAIDKLGGFDSKQKSCQEYELWIRIACNYKLVGIKEPLGIYNVSGDSTFKGNYDKYVTGDDAIIKKHIKLFKLYPKSYSNHYLHMATYMLKQRQIKRFINYKIRAWRVCWNNPQNLTIVHVVNRLIQKRYR